MQVILVQKFLHLGADRFWYARGIWEEMNTLTFLCISLIGKGKSKGNGSVGAQLKKLHHSPKYIPHHESTFPLKRSKYFKR